MSTLDLLKLLTLDLSDRPAADTSAWLVWRQGKDGPQFLGILPTQETAEEEARLLNVRDPGWTVTHVAMMGQGWTDRVRELVAHSARFERWRAELDDA